jgi:hypothetical protein
MIVYFILEYNQNNKPELSSPYYSYEKVVEHVKYELKLEYGIYPFNDGTSRVDWNIKQLPKTEPKMCYGGSPDGLLFFAENCYVYRFTIRDGEPAGENENAF